MTGIEVVPRHDAVTRLVMTRQAFRRSKMKRTTLTASVAAGLMAAAIASPAWAQATTYPEGTDCSAISNAANQAECLNQMNESRQNPVPGSVAPDPNGTGNIQPGRPNAPDSSASPPANSDAAPTSPGNNGNVGDGSPPSN
jgi:hypothetical protein